MTTKNPSNKILIATLITEFAPEIDAEAATAVIFALKASDLDFTIRRDRLNSKRIIRDVLLTCDIGCSVGVAAQVRDTLIAAGFVGIPSTEEPEEKKAPKPKRKQKVNAKYELCIEVEGSTGRIYRIEKHIDSGKVRCNCRSFIYGNSPFGRNTCKHIEAIRDGGEVEAA